MKYQFTGLFILLLIIQLNAQDQYFQQQVNHTIRATLNDSTHVLTADQKITYINNSPHSLEKIYFHLWGNAYRNNATAFAQQQLRLQKTDFYFSDEKDRGGYQFISFSIDGEQVKYNEYSSHLDIVVLQLNEKIPPGKSVEINIDFKLKIPKSFSRLGRTKNAYQLTQWYPKPAVYDQQGWHPMPYLDQGEFYSEFGNYEVEITLPKKYIVAGTGTLQTEKERAKLIEKSKQLKDIKDVARLKARLRDTISRDQPKGQKTLRYTARNIHDFALFADQNFQVQHKKSKVTNGDSVDIWAFFTARQAALWMSSLTYLERSMNFYSKELGPYPYPQVTAVEGALSAGAGMEYPMITIIPTAQNDRALDNVITHEVGHNWWYSILASNERKVPWLDEGVNSFYEKLYMAKYYPPVSKSLNEMIEGGSSDEGRWIWEVQAQKHQDQSPGLASDEFTEINYYLAAYWKPAQAFLHLSKYIGHENLREAMQEFYKEYKFKHFAPDDLRDHLEDELDQELSWLFDDLLNSDKSINYRITSLQKKRRSWNLKLKNTGKVNAPVSVGGYASDSTFIDRWLEGFEGEAEIRIRDRDYLEAIQINPHENLPESRIGDNLRRIEGEKVKGKPLKLGFVAGLHRPYQNNLFVTPALGYNAYDGFQIGLWVHNVGIPSKSFEFSILPNLGVASNKITAIGDGRYRWFFNVAPGGIHHLDIGLGFRNYSYTEDEQYGYNDRYLKIAPYLDLHFKNDPLSYYGHFLRYRTVFIQQNYHLGIDISEGIFSDELRNYWVHELSYNFENDHPIRPYHGKAQVEYISGAWRYAAHFTQEFQYTKNNFIKFKLFAGGLSNYEQSPVDVRLYGAGQTGFWLNQRDYKFDYVMLGRNETNGLLSKQIFNRDASLKTISNEVMSTSFMAGLGVKIDLPIPIVPVKPYFDVVIYDDLGQLTTDFSSGLAISIFKETLEVYFPLWESQNIRNSLAYRNNPGYFQRVTFSLNLRKWGVFKIKDQLNLY